MIGRMGAASPHVLMSHTLVPNAAQAVGKQASPQPPSQSQAAAAAAAAATAQSAPIAVSPLPPSAIAAPATQAPAIAPLSAGPGQITESSGGPARTDLTASSTASSTSPSEAAPSTPGGGGDTLQACMGFWDRGTHMSKVEWRAACARTLDRLDLHTPVP